MVVAAVLGLAAALALLGGFCCIVEQAYLDSKPPPYAAVDVAVAPDFSMLGRGQLAEELARRVRARERSPSRV